MLWQSKSVWVSVQKCKQKVIRGAVKEKHREVHDTCQDAVEIEMSSEGFDTVSSKVFYLHSNQSVIIKLKVIKKLKYGNIR